MGFTLLEVLLALALLSSVMVLAFGWLHQVCRYGSALTTASEARRSLIASRDALRVDLTFAIAAEAGAAPFTVDEDGALSCRTLAAGPDAPGLRTVRWQFDGERELLLREVEAGADDEVVIVGGDALAPGLQVVSDRFAVWRFFTEDDGLWIEARARDDARRQRCLVVAQ